MGIRTLYVVLGVIICITVHVSAYLSDFRRRSNVFRKTLLPPAAKAIWSEDTFKSQVRGDGKVYNIWLAVALPFNTEKGENSNTKLGLPLVVVHGGPGLPSDYLRDGIVTATMGHRPVVFWDQLGCGASDHPDDPRAYSITQSVEELHTLITFLREEKVHIVGQNWGGILAFEYISAHGIGRVASLTLLSTPSSVALVEASAHALLGEEELTASQAAIDAFEASHVCTFTRRAPLDRALARAGVPGLWQGSSSIRDWEASKDDMVSLEECPTLVIRGEYDFVSRECISAWLGIPDVKVVELEGCRHHVVLENPGEFGRVLEKFLTSHDP